MDRPVHHRLDTASHQDHLDMKVLVVLAMECRVITVLMARDMDNVVVAVVAQVDCVLVVLYGPNTSSVYMFIYKIFTCKNCQNIGR